MSFDMKNMQKMLKQAQKMQAEMMEQKGKLEAQLYEATAGGNMVTVKVNGAMDLVSISISKDCVDPDDIEMLQDLVKVAVNEALKKAKADAEQSMASLTAGLKLPGM